MTDPRHPQNSAQQRPIQPYPSLNQHTFNQAQAQLFSRLNVEEQQGFLLLPFERQQQLFSSIFAQMQQAQPHQNTPSNSQQYVQQQQPRFSSHTHQHPSAQGGTSSSYSPANPMVSTTSNIPSVNTSASQSSGLPQHCKWTYYCAFCAEKLEHGRKGTPTLTELQLDHYGDDQSPVCAQASRDKLKELKAQGRVPEDVNDTVATEHVTRRLMCALGACEQILEPRQVQLHMSKCRFAYTLGTTTASPPNLITQPPQNVQLHDRQWGGSPNQTVNATSQLRNPNTQPQQHHHTPAAQPRTQQNQNMYMQKQQQSGMMNMQAQNGFPQRNQHLANRVMQQPQQTSGNIQQQQSGTPMRIARPTSGHVEPPAGTYNKPVHPGTLPRLPQSPIPVAQVERNVQGMAHTFFPASASDQATIQVRYGQLVNPGMPVHHPSTKMQVPHQGNIQHDSILRSSPVLRSLLHGGTEENPIRLPPADTPLPPPISPTALQESLNSIGRAKAYVLPPHPDSVSAENVTAMVQRNLASSLASDVLTSLLEPDVQPSPPIRFGRRLSCTTAPVSAVISEPRALVPSLEAYSRRADTVDMQAQNADAAPEPGGNGTAVPSEPTVLPSIATPIKPAVITPVGNPAARIAVEKSIEKSPLSDFETTQSCNSHGDPKEKDGKVDDNITVVDSSMEEAVTEAKESPAPGLDSTPTLETVESKSNGMQQITQHMPDTHDKHPKRPSGSDVSATSAKRKRSLENLDSNVKTAEKAPRKKIRKFICKCGHLSDDRSLFLTHFRRHIMEGLTPQEKKWQCPRLQCGYVGLGSADLSRHVARHILLQHAFRLRNEQQRSNPK